MMRFCIWNRWLFNKKGRKNMKWIRKKTKGDSTYLATLIAIFVILVLFTSLFYVYAQIQKQNKVERVYRQYLLEMETKGYLTSSAKARLISDLTACGVENIDLTGTSQSPVGYGQPVYLCIKGDLKVDRLNFVGSNASKGQGVMHIDIKKSGTALY